MSDGHKEWGSIKGPSESAKSQPPLNVGDKQRELLRDWVLSVKTSSSDAGVQDLDQPIDRFEARVGVGVLVFRADPQETNGTWDDQFLSEMQSHHSRGLALAPIEF
jgi:hypothetical protein